MKKKITIDKLAELVGKKENYTLEDVLVAIKKTNLSNFLPIALDLINYRDKKWIFNKPLSQQSKETINFLYYSICK